MIITPQLCTYMYKQDMNHIQVAIKLVWRGENEPRPATLLSNSTTAPKK